MSVVLSRLLLLSILWFGCCAQAASADTVADHLRQYAQRLQSDQPVWVFERALYARSSVARFFEMRDYRPLWLATGQATAILEVLAAADQQGLYPGDYHYPQLLAFVNKHQTTPQSAFEKARFELLMTDAVLLYAHHQIRGKIDPKNLEQSWNYNRRQLLQSEVLASLSRHAALGDVADRLRQLQPQSPLFHRLRAGLSRYREIAETYPFETIASTPLLRPGDSHSGVSALRWRLRELGYLTVNSRASEDYDSALQTVVKLFQRNHGLADDGVIGGQSWRALNIPYSQRVDMLRINMERARWVDDHVSDEFVAVNIAGFKLYYVRDGEVIWTTPVMTGTIAHETPVFASKISYMEFNPTWTVPRSILRRSLINKFKNDPASVEREHFKLLGRDGVAVDPALLDWNKLHVDNFPYTAVQQPSDINALGQVKFMFPNDYAIYLHDTPGKQLFSRSARAFSAGCVRVQNPFELAKLLMNDEQSWSLENIQQVVDSRQRRHVSLPTPVDVMLLYWTAEPGQGDRLRFNPDIYQRDATLLAALQQPMQ